MKTRILTFGILALAVIMLSSCGMVDNMMMRANDTAIAQANAQAAEAYARSAVANGAALSAQAIAASSIHAETESSVRLMAFLAYIQSSAGLTLVLGFVLGMAGLILPAIVIVMIFKRN